MNRFFSSLGRVLSGLCVAFLVITACYGVLALLGVEVRSGTGGWFAMKVAAATAFWGTVSYLRPEASE